MQFAHCHIFCICFLSEGRAGFAVAEDDEWSPALELDGVGMMDLPNGQSSISTSAATVSEVRPHPRQFFKMQPVYTHERFSCIIIIY